MSLHVVVGAGAVGAATARLLAARGHRVRLVTRRGTGPADPAVELVRADATDTTALRALVEGADALYNCAAPPYWRWTTDFPPLAESLLQVAEATGAVLVNAGNLYAYGPVDGPITEGLPLAATGAKGRVRARIWRDAVASHQAGRARVTEARASDYIGAGALSFLTEMALKPLAAGRPAVVPADLDAPHSWTYTGDVAHTLVALADDEQLWGRPWHVPSEPPLSVREIVNRAAAVADRPAPRLLAMPNPVLRLAGLLAPVGSDTAKMARELIEVGYQRDRPWALDSTAATSALGITPTPLDDSLRETMDHLRTGSNG
jgi:nucleoside-diphosphate-sugar epimerase